MPVVCRVFMWKVFKTCLYRLKCLGNFLDFCKHFFHFPKPKSNVSKFLDILSRAQNILSFFSKLSLEFS